jgi:hypothetical protein
MPDPCDQAGGGFGDDHSMGAVTRPKREVGIDEYRSVAGTSRGALGPARGKAMLRRILWILGIILGLALAAALLGPFLISTQSLAGLEPADPVATPESRFVEIPFPGTEGLRLHFLAAGSGHPPAAPVFILLHGFTFNAFTWQPALDFFARQGRVFAFDQIPYGLSAKPTVADWDGPNPYAKEAAIVQLFRLHGCPGHRTGDPGGQLLGRDPGHGGGPGQARAGRTSDPGGALGLRPAADPARRRGGVAPVTPPQPPDCP